MELNLRSLFGTVTKPVRVGANDLLLNTFDGWLSERVPAPVMSWIGLTQSDYGPVGPGGGHPFGWSSPGGVPAAADRAAALLVGPLVSVAPVRWYRGPYRGSSDAAELPPPLWFVDPQLAGGRPGPVSESPIRVNARLTASRVWGDLLRSAVWFGRGYLDFAVSPDGGQPVAGSVQTLSPAAVDDSDGGGWLVGRDDFGDPLETDADGFYVLGGVRRRVACLREPFGEGGVIGRHASALGLGVHVRNYATGTFRSGIPNGYLKVSSPGLTQDQADVLKARWLDAHGGDRRSIAVLNATTEFVPISVSPVDAQLVDVDGLVLRMIAHAFNLPASALDSGAAGGSLTYANVSQDRQTLVDGSLRPWSVVFDDLLSNLMPFGTWADHDYRGYLATDPAQRTAYYQAGLDGGWLSVDEIRGIEHLPVIRTRSEVVGDVAS